MACMGPDLKAAKSLGRSVGGWVLQELIETHHLYDITDPKYDKMFQWPGARKRWLTSKRRFVRAVEKLFEEDAVNSF